MRRVHSRDTKPELVVRRLVSSMGLRYRLHSKSLSGHPDLVFGRLHKVIFVHGCFWHGHYCPAATLPESNKEYWEAKRSRNVIRDKRVLRALRRAGWKALVLWECEVKKEKARKRIARFLTEGEK